MFPLCTDIILIVVEIAIAKAAQILDDERVRPTVAYEPTPMEAEAQLMSSSSAWAVVAAFGQMGRSQALSSERKQRPRPVHNTSEGFQFKSVNFELLLGLFSQVEDDDRRPFIASLLSRVSHWSSLFAVRSFTSRFPSWNNYLSELPLVAEFCVRIGSKEELFHAISQASPTPGLIVLLLTRAGMSGSSTRERNDARKELGQIYGIPAGIRVAVAAGRRIRRVLVHPHQASTL